MVDETMANAARVHAVESGTSFAGRALIAFGGGGPVHACRIAEKLGVARVLVPQGAGVGSAIGFLRAPVAYEVVRSLYQRLSSFDPTAVTALLEAMAAEAQAVVAAGSFGAPASERRLAFMRYVGQGHEIPVPLPPGKLRAESVAVIRSAYDAAYSRFYDRPVPGSDVEIMSYAVLVATATAPSPAAPSPAVPPAPTAVAAARTERRQKVRDTTTGAVADWAVYERTALAPGARIAGPAIVAEAETSTLIGPGWIATVATSGWLELAREAG